MPAAKPTVLLVGLGHLGGVLLEFLARADWVGRVVACSRNRERGETRCNLARLGAIAEGCSPEIEYRQVDITDGQKFAETMDSLTVDLIVSTATMQTWWLPEMLPTAARERLQKAKFGMWLPLHLAPTLSLMEAIAESSFAGPVLTAPFPDVVNCILGQIGLAPTCGVGNIDELVAKVRWSAATYVETSLESIQAIMVAHHALESAVFAGKDQETAPYFLRILHDGTDVTESLPLQEILFSPSPLPTGPGTAFFTVGSTMRLMRALLADEETLIHVPAPNGLPGGYPVLAGGSRVANAAIEGLELEEAVDINERSHPFDGIERIENDGTAVFVAESAEIMRTELGYDCSELLPADAANRGRELATRFREYAGRHGVDLTRVA